MAVSVLSDRGFGRLLLRVLFDFLLWFLFFLLGRLLLFRLLLRRFFLRGLFLCSLLLLRLLGVVLLRLVFLLLCVLGSGRRVGLRLLGGCLCRGFLL